MAKTKMTLDRLAWMMNKRFDDQDKKISHINLEVLVVKEDIKRLEDRVENLTKTVNNLIISVDKLAKSVETLTQEYSAISVQMNRHEEWIKLVANKVGVKLEI
jgi:archaellum component FlaC